MRNLLVAALSFLFAGSVAAVEVAPAKVRATVNVPTTVDANMVMCTSEARAKSFVQSAVLAGKAGWEGEILAIRDSKDINDMCAVLSAKVKIVEVLATGVAPDGMPLAAVKLDVNGKTLYSPTVGVVFKRASEI